MQHSSCSQTSTINEDRDRLPSGQSRGMGQLNQNQFHGSFNTHASEASRSVGGQQIPNPNQTGNINAQGYQNSQTMYHHSNSQQFNLSQRTSASTPNTTSISRNSAEPFSRESTVDSREREGSQDAHSQYSNNQRFNSFRPYDGLSQSTSASTPTSTSITRNSAEPFSRETTVESDATAAVLKKRTNFSDDHLIQLCTSWLHVSQNAITGNDQRFAMFWKKITIHYNHSMDKDNQRTLKSLECRWSTLNRNMCKYAACLQQIKNLKQSGKSPEDELTEALALYKQDCNGTAFKDMSSFNIVKHAPKWQENPAYLEHRGHGNSLGSDMHGLDLGSDIENLPRMDRPTGTKQAKKRGGGHSSLAEEIAPKMIENSTQVAMSSRDLANHSKEAQATFSKIYDYTVLTTNLSSIDECVRAEFQAEREEIIRKRRARRVEEGGRE